MNRDSTFLQSAAWLLVCSLLLVFIVSVSCEAQDDDSLVILNGSSSDLLNILVTPASKEADKFFLRLDLEPGGEDKISMISGINSLRVDTGLQLWLFPDINFSHVKKIAFQESATPYLLLEGAGEQTKRVDGQSKNLVPDKEAKPVCELNQFRAHMPMKEVCTILSPDAPRDDNGALLTGVGFGGAVWAARLIPVQDGPVTDSTLLEHLELRRPLVSEEVVKILSVLYSQGYVPWQAEFPDNDLDFAATAKNYEKSKKLLESHLKLYLEKSYKDPAANKKDTASEVSIMLAPENILPELANADAPTKDVQLFTLILKPATRTFIVDVSAYEGEQTQDSKADMKKPGD